MSVVTRAECPHKRGLGYHDRVVAGYGKLGQAHFNLIKIFYNKLLQLFADMLIGRNAAAYDKCFCARLLERSPRFCNKYVADRILKLSRKLRLFIFI